MAWTPTPGSHRTCSDHPDHTRAQVSSGRERCHPVRQTPRALESLRPARFRVGATLVVAHAIAPAGRAVAHAGFPMASFGSVRDATRAWDATSYEGNEAVLDSGWATARVAPTRASWPGCSGVGATLVVAHACRRPRLSSPTLVVAHAIAPQGASSPMPGSRWPRSGRHGTPQGRGTPPRTKETKPCWIRDGRPRGSPLRGPRGRAVRV